jgi:uncharacterized membrane protein YjgN (DUF898 family)
MVGQVPQRCELFFAPPSFQLQELFMARSRDDDDDDDRDDDYEEAPKKKKRARRTGSFEFDGGAGDFLVVGLLSALLYVFTLGLGAPWVVCMLKRWEAEHTLVEGRRLRFDGAGSSLLGLFIVGYFLSIITLGIYLLWFVPKIQKWIVENTEFEDAD